MLSLEGACFNATGNFLVYSGLGIFQCLLSDIQQYQLHTVCGENFGKMETDIRADITGTDNGDF